MKSTKTMLALIATFLTTWLFLGLIGYLVSDITYKECLTSNDLIFLMVIFGWVPSVIVWIDLAGDL